MSHYLLTEEQLAENGYPRPTEEVGMASINWGNSATPDIQPVGPNGRYTVCSVVVALYPSLTAMQHRCCRCNSTLIIYNNGQYQTVDKCSYHHGRVIRVNGRSTRTTSGETIIAVPCHAPEPGQGMVRVYSCCRQEQGSSSGCVLADVWSIPHILLGQGSPVVFHLLLRCM